MKSSSEGAKVKDLLHRLRGENFRRERNAKRVQAPSSSSLSYKPPSLPPDIFRSNDVELPTQPPPPQARTAGPVPKSWTQQSSKALEVDRDSTEWREHSLTTLIYKHLSPPANTGLDAIRLPLLCLLVLYQSCEPDQLLDEVFPHIPLYLRRDFIRYCAIHHPLDSAILYRLTEPWGHVDGELIVVGPKAHLRRGLWKDLNAPVQDMGLDVHWESDGVSPQALYTLLLVSIELTTPRLLTFPFTIVRLALINTSYVPVQKLTTLCPLLEVLDLSYNSWLKPAQLWEISWSRWSSLQVLGLRGITIPMDFELMINGGRWDEVQIVI